MAERKKRRKKKLHAQGLRIGNLLNLKRVYNNHYTINRGPANVTGRWLPATCPQATGPSIYIRSAGSEGDVVRDTRHDLSARVKKKNPRRSPRLSWAEWLRIDRAARTSKHATRVIIHVAPLSAPAVKLPPRFMRGAFNFSSTADLVSLSGHARLSPRPRGSIRSDRPTMLERATNAQEDLVFKCRQIGSGILWDASMNNIHMIRGCWLAKLSVCKAAPASRHNSILLNPNPPLCSVIRNMLSSK